MMMIICVLQYINSIYYILITQPTTSIKLLGKNPPLLPSSAVLILRTLQRINEIVYRLDGKDGYLL
jgi:hypothetical protein